MKTVFTILFCPCFYINAWCDDVVPILLEMGKPFSVESHNRQPFSTLDVNLVNDSIQIRNTAKYSFRKDGQVNRIEVNLGNTLNPLDDVFDVPSVENSPISKALEKIFSHAAITSIVFGEDASNCSLPPGKQNGRQILDLICQSGGYSGWIVRFETTQRLVIKDLTGKIERRDDVLSKAYGTVSFIAKKSAKSHGSQ